MPEKPLVGRGGTFATSLSKETVFAENGIVSRSVFSAAATRVTLFAFSEGQELTEHTSARHALVQVLTGRCDFTVEGKVHALAAGDFLYMPPGAAHSVLATEPFSMLLTLVKPDEAAQR